MTDAPPPRSIRRSILRETGHSHASVGNAELFFDLVYVFAVTQVSHFLLKHHDLTGVLQTIVLFLAVWWAWIYTIWATNWLDPDRFWTRVMIFSMMLVGLTMSASLPKAFGDHGLVFACAYTGAQILRSVFVVLAHRRERPKVASTMARATLWFVATAPLWIAGALSPPDTRLILWAAALAIEYAAPLALFRVPGMGRSITRDFNVSGHHMAERCSLFIIIALGEGILVTGATIAEMSPTPATLAAFITAFLGSVAMWWIYFDRGAVRGTELIADAEDSGKVARDTYTYLHLLIVGGVIVAAVADEMLLAHPIGHAAPAFIATAIGGPALFLAAVMRFKRGFTGFYPLSHLVGLGLFALLAFAAILLHLDALVIGIGGVAVLMIVAIWEWRSFHGGWVSRARQGIERT